MPIARPATTDHTPTVKTIGFIQRRVKPESRNSVCGIRLSVFGISQSNTEHRRGNEVTARKPYPESPPDRSVAQRPTVLPLRAFRIPLGALRLARSLRLLPEHRRASAPESRIPNAACRLAYHALRRLSPPAAYRRPHTHCLWTVVLSTGCTPSWRAGHCWCS